MSDRSDLAYRYGMPSRTNRLVALVLIGALAIGGVGFVSWTVIFHGDPDVQSQLTAYDVRSEHETDAVLTVARDSQSTRAVCVVRALAADHAVVGEQTVTVADGPATQTVRVTIRTERAATGVDPVGCTTEDQLRPG